MVSRGVLVGTGLAVAGVALGAGLAVGAGQVLGDEATDPVPSTTRPLAVGQQDPDVVPRDLGPAVRAATPAEAVEQFLAAEAAGDTDGSFALLSDADRRTFGSAGAWQAGHPDVVPPVEGTTTTSAPTPTGDSATAQVVTTTDFTSSLDAVAGLVPARATVTWSVRREGAGWAVDLEGTTQQPLLPRAEDAAPAAAAWAQAAQECEPEREQYASSLRGRPALAQELCGAAGAISTGAAEPLAPEDATPFTNVYGGDAAGWARAVPVSGPTDLRVVLAPVEDRWQVVGLLGAA